MTTRENIIELDHHKKQELCTTRPAYRQGRKLTAIKVYSVNNESVYLLIYGVPSINLRSELKTLCQRYGTVLSLVSCLEYPSEDFTECFRIKYERIQSARVAKRMLDTKNYFGGVLHVCYAPERETVDETRKKLADRRAEIAKRLKFIEKANNAECSTSSQSNLSAIQSNHPSNLNNQLNLLPNYDSTNFSDSTGGYRQFNPVCLSTSSYSNAGSSSDIHHVQNTRLQAEYKTENEHCAINFKQNNVSGFTSGLNGYEIASRPNGTSNLDLPKKRKTEEKEYVFRNRRKKKDRDLEDKIKSLEDKKKEVTNSLTMIGPQLPDNINCEEETSNPGRVVVCEHIEKPRIFKIPTKSLNKIVFNIKKDS